MIGRVDISVCKPYEEKPTWFIIVHKTYSSEGIVIKVTVMKSLLFFVVELPYIVLKFTNQVCTPANA